MLHAHTGPGPHLWPGSSVRTSTVRRMVPSGSDGADQEGASLPASPTCRKPARGDLLGKPVHLCDYSTGPHAALLLLADNLQNRRSRSITSSGPERGLHEDQASFAIDPTRK